MDDKTHSTKLRLIDHVESGISRACDSDDPWDRDDTWESHDPQAFEISEGSWFDVVVPGKVNRGDRLYLVHAIYNTGDSFGHDEGLINIIDAFKNQKKAQACADAAQKSEASQDYTFEYKNDVGVVVKAHTPWNGYFESLSGVYVTELPVRK